MPRTTPGRSSLRRLLVVPTVLAAALASGAVVATPAPAQADEVATAQERVDRLQSVLGRTTRQLSEGTARWEADQAQLRRVRLQLHNTQRHVAAAQRVADETQERLDTLAGRLYQAPFAASSALLVTTPDTFVDHVHSQQLVEHLAGNDEATIARARTARHRLRQQQAEVEALAGQATLLVDASARRMAALQKQAQHMSDQLEQAQTALQTARARRDAALARAARERAARHRASFAGGPTCTGKSTAGQQNGNLDPASLCPLWRAPGHRLRADAAAAFNKLSRYHAATLGSPLCVTDSYRSYSEQVSLYRRKPGLAAVPGTSNHGWGQAVDFCGGIQNSGSDAYRWMKQNAGRFGWFHPDWAEPSGSKPEAWHWEYGG